MQRSIIFLAVFILAALLAPSVSAQTVGAVLRALQERKVILEYRDSYSPEYPDDPEVDPQKEKVNTIEWGNELPPFPRDEDITSLPQAIDVLNRASRAFDEIKSSYLAYDVVRKQPINLRHTAGGFAERENQVIRGGSGQDQWILPKDISYDYALSSFVLAPIDLPSVGSFNELNWRVKLPALASNINQLRALGWPYTRQFAKVQTGDYPDLQFPPGDPFDPPLDPQWWEVDFPFLLSSDWSPSDKARLLTDDSPIWLENSGFIVSGNLLSWRAHAEFNHAAEGADFPYTSSSGYTLLEFLTGIRARLGPRRTLPPVLGASITKGRFDFFKAPLVRGFGDLMEAIVKEQPTGDEEEEPTLLLGALSPIKSVNMNGTSSLAEIGNFREPNPPFWMDSVADPNAPTALVELQSALTWMNLRPISITGDLVSLPEEVASEYSEDVNYYYLQLDKSAKHRRLVGASLSGGGTLDIDLVTILVPQFSPLLVPQSLPADVRRVGEIEPSVRYWEMLRLHVGNGKTDRFQSAWLGVRPDGFGSMIFHGSPNEFELLYDDASTRPSSKNAPIGGATFDSPIVFTETAREQSGWSSRFDYISEWFSPHLKQVMGGDVLVTIDYLTPYEKKLSFYWSGDAGLFDGRFYTPTGSPFKTISIKNPTVPSSGAAIQLPTEKNHLLVVEDGVRFHRLRYEHIQQLRNGIRNGWDENFIFTLEDSDGQVTSESHTKVPYRFLQDNGAEYPNPYLIPWVCTETTEGTSVTTLLEWEGGASPLWSDPPILKSIVAQGGLRRIDNVWHWANGEEVLAGKESWFPRLLSTTGGGTSEWPGKDRMVTFSKTGLLYSDKSRVGDKIHEYSQAWSGNVLTKTWSLDQNTYRSLKESYSSGLNTVETSVGGKLVATTKYDASSFPTSASYAGGFRHSFSMSIGDRGTALFSSSGWGPMFNSGQTEYVELSKLGEVSARDVSTSEGVVLIEDKGSDFTGWGAAKTITHLRGDVSTRAYKESGASWGRQTTGENPFGVIRGITNYDWLSRPAGINTGYETFTGDFSVALAPKFSAPSGASFESSFSAFGELLERQGTDDALNEFKFAPGGSGYVKDHANREKTVVLDRAGIPTSIGDGAGSRGGTFNYGAESGMLFSESTTAGATVRTYYDYLGRVVRIERPDETGSSAKEEWVYDDENRRVTYKPVPSPAAEEIVSSLSTNGEILTVSKGGVEILRFRREAANDKLVRLTELNDDSSGGGWKEMAREELDPASGSISATPWGLASASSAGSSTAPGATATSTISDGHGGTLTITYTNGLPTGITGNQGGVPVNLGESGNGEISYTRGRLKLMTGFIGAHRVELEIDPKGRVDRIWGPGSKKSFGYGVGSEFLTTISDSEQETTHNIGTSSVGDLTKLSGDGRLSLSMSTLDKPGGPETKIGITGASPSVTIQQNHYGSTVAKDYTGGLNESFTLQPDGSLSGHMTSTTGGDSESVVIMETPRTRTTTYAEGTISEKFYVVGPRSEVDAPKDGRKFTYEHLSLKTESHDDGVWSGWSVERIPDEKGRLRTLKISDGSVAREFGFRYDAHSRLRHSVSSQMTGIYTPTQSGKLSSLTRGPLMTSWGYDGIDRLAKVSNTMAGAVIFNYSYGEQQLGAGFGPDKRHRIKNRVASVGKSWNGMVYDDADGNADQLKSAGVGDGRTLTYSYDARGNRNGQEVVDGNPDNVNPGANHTIPALDQIRGRTLTARGFAVYGALNPLAELKVTHLLEQSGLILQQESQTGEFYRWWDLPGTTTNMVDVRVQGTLTAENNNGRKEIAEKDLRLVIPPMSETFGFDPAGRTKTDAFWEYKWDKLGRLYRMDRNPAMLREPGSTAEVVEYDYDADGRRTQKTRTITYTNGSRIEKSRVLWSGWLPLLEERSRDGNVIDKRWFQWGADLSGTLDGAGGIGGLVAIIEEKPGKQPRTLLPVQDGLGNVTGVIDSASAKVVARYDYGPFGEPLGEYGETDACPFRWQTKWFDTESEHYYFGYRYYSPRLGRWLSRDPLGEAGGFNLYAYCGNDPVNRCDPLGMEGKKREAPAEKFTRKLAQVMEQVDKVTRKAGKEIAHMDRCMRQLEGNIGRGWDMMEAGLDQHYEGGTDEFGRQLFLGIGDPIRGLAFSSMDNNQPLWQRIAAGEYSAYALDPTRNPRFLGGVLGGELMGQGMVMGFKTPTSLSSGRLPNGLEALRRSREILDRYYLENGVPDLAFGMANRKGFEISPFASGTVLSLSGESVGFSRSTYTGGGYVYVLRDKRTNMFLKVGKTSGGGNIYERFNLYRRKGVQRRYDLEVEFWEMADDRMALDIEGQMRRTLDQSGFSLPWDGMTSRNKFVPWRGLPWKRTLEPPFDIE